MKKYKIYLYTSVISFIFADDSPDFKDITIDFFENFSKNYDLFISEIVILEINKNTDIHLKNDTLQSIERYNIKKLEYDEEVNKIAKNYIINKIIPESKIEDALHISYVTFMRLMFYYPGILSI